MNAAATPDSPPHTPKSQPQLLSVTLLDVAPWRLPWLWLRLRRLQKATDSSWWRLCGTGTLQALPGLPKAGEDPQFGLLPHPRRWMVLSYGGDAESRFKAASNGFLKPYCSAAYIFAPLRARGTWQGTQPMPDSYPDLAQGHDFATITRAGNHWWANTKLWISSLPDIVHQLGLVPGNQEALGLVHWPTLGAITFSVWDSESDMEQFAYGRGGAHRREIGRAVKGRWFRETWYARFAVLRRYGSAGRVTQAQQSDRAFPEKQPAGKDMPQLYEEQDRQYPLN